MIGITSTPPMPTVPTTYSATIRDHNGVIVDVYRYLNGDLGHLWVGDFQSPAAGETPTVDEITRALADAGWALDTPWTPRLTSTGMRLQADLTVTPH